jgi:hypothetical protein
MRENDESLEAPLESWLMSDQSREREPRPEMEELLVQQLRVRGVLRGAGIPGSPAELNAASATQAAAATALHASAGAPIRGETPLPPLPRLYVVSPRGNAARRFFTAAAALLLFISGIAVGEARARGSAPHDRPGAGGAESSGSALHVASEAYLEALAQVAASDSLVSTLALQSFRKAADQVVRLAPESSIALALQIAYPTSFVSVPAGVVAQMPTRLIWY